MVVVIFKGIHKHTFAILRWSSLPESLFYPLHSVIVHCPQYVFPLESYYVSGYVIVIHGVKRDS